MTSKSPKDLYKKVSQNLNQQGLELNEAVVEQFNKFVFGRIRKMQDSFEHLEIYVPKLGVWKIRRKRLDKHIQEIQNRKIPATNGDVEEQERRQAVFEANLERMRRLSERHEEMIGEKYRFKNQTNELRSSQGSLQEPEQNMGGTEEQGI